MLENLCAFLVRSFHGIKSEGHNYADVYNAENLVTMSMIL